MILACSTMMVSCDSWLEVKPYDKISEGELQKSEEGYQKMLNGIYIDLNSDALYGQSLSVEMIEVMGGAYAIGTDNSVWGNYKDLSNYQYGTEYWRNRLDQTWNKAYALILNCNKILENIDQNQGLFTGGNYYAVKGEALALRAMLHFDMLRLFGPVYAKDSDKKAIPYYNKQTNSPEPILTAKEVAEKVVADLEEARILLANDPVKTEGTLMSGSQDGTSNFMRYRALRLNYYAVEALLARVNLYMGNKTEAFKYATDVIKTADQGIFPFVDKSLVIGSPADPDRIFSSEVLFALTNTFCPRKWTLDERRNGIVNYVMGLCFVSEGAIPYAAVDPLRVLPSCVVGSAVAGALSMTFGCALRAPHGGIFVFPVVDHAALYCVALAVGSVLGAVILSLVKKTQPAEAK